jgi:hypothetical protein
MIRKAQPTKKWLVGRMTAMNNPTQAPSKDVSIYEHNPALETLPQIKARDAKDYPEHYTNPWAKCAMEDRHWLLAEIERLQAREREAFRLANAATYLVAPKYSLHAELKAFMDGQISKPEDYSGHEPGVSYRDLMKQAERDGVPVEQMVKGLTDKIEAQRRELARLNRERAAQPGDAPKLISTVEMLREVEDTLIDLGWHKDRGVLKRVTDCLDEVGRNTLTKPDEQP